MKRKPISEYYVVALYCDTCGKPMKQYQKFTNKGDFIVFYRCENKHEVGIQFTDKMFGPA